MEKTISFGQAWAHCFGTTSYVVWLIIAVIIGAVLIWYAFAKETDEWRGLIFFAGMVIIAFALLMRPAEIAANTTPEEASKGQWIGY